MLMCRSISGSPALRLDIEHYIVLICHIFSCWEIYLRFAPYIKLPCTRSLEKGFSFLPPQHHFFTLSMGLMTHDLAGTTFAIFIHQFWIVLSLTIFQFCCDSAPYRTIIHYTETIKSFVFFPHCAIFDRTFHEIGGAHVF